MIEINLIEPLHDDSGSKDETYFAYSTQPFYEKNQLFFRLIILGSNPFFEAHLFLFLHLPSCYPSAVPSVSVRYFVFCIHPTLAPTPRTRPAFRGAASYYQGYFFSTPSSMKQPKQPLPTIKKGRSQGTAFCIGFIKLSNQNHVAFLGIRFIVAGTLVTEYVVIRVHRCFLTRNIPIPSAVYIVRFPNALTPTIEDFQLL